MQTRRYPKRWLVVSVLIGLMLTLVACGGQQAPPASNEGSNGDGQQAAQEQVTLRWFMRWDQIRLENVARPVIEAFEKKHPNINVEIENVGSGSEYWTKLQTMIAGGTAPDVVYPATHNGYALASKDALRSIDDFIAQDNIDLSKYDPAILELYKYNGKLFGLPLDSAALVVFYNRNMFDEAGVEPPSPTWTWDDFLAAAKALTKDVNGDSKIDQYGVDSFTNYWPVIVWCKTGHNIFDDPKKPTKWLLGDADSVEALQWMADLINAHHVMPSAAERADISDMFIAGKSAMKIIGHWRVPQYMKNIQDFEWNVAPLPRGQIAANRADGSSFAITAQSEHPEEAWEFIKFLAGPESMGMKLLLDLQQMTPALIEYQQSDAFLHPKSLPGVDKTAFLAGKEHLFTMYDPLHPVYDEINEVQQAELTELWNGNVTAQEAIDRMRPQIEQFLNSVEQ